MARYQLRPMHIGYVARHGLITDMSDISRVRSKRQGTHVGKQSTNGALLE